MEHTIIKEMFESRSQAKDFILEHPEIIIDGAEVIENNLKGTRRSIDVLMKKDDVFYFVGVKDKESIYVARKQLNRYGRMFELFNKLSNKNKIRFVIVKIQKYLGTDVYYFDDCDDLMKRRNEEYSKINYDRTMRTQSLPEIKEKWKKAITSEHSQDKWKKNWESGMEKFYNKKFQISDVVHKTEDIKVSIHNKSIEVCN